jgi:hypothetical protein
VGRPVAEYLIKDEMKQFRWFGAFVVGALLLAACGGLQAAVPEGEVALASTYPKNISGTVDTVPEISVVMDHGMIPLRANTTSIGTCAYFLKFEGETGSITVFAPGDLEGDVTFSVSGNKTSGYTVQVVDTIPDWTAVLDEVYFGVGNNARKFTFAPPVTYASPLPAPLNANNPADISHTFFCYDLILTVDEVGDWYGETAWAADGHVALELPYNPDQGGNWATYVDARDRSNPFDTTLFAGRTLEAGNVEFSTANGVVTITIELDAGWRFESGSVIAVQGYEFAPSGNPSPGKFAKKEPVTNATTMTVVVAAADFYGVHANVERDFVP